MYDYDEADAALHKSVENELLAERERTIAESLAKSGSPIFDTLIDYGLDLYDDETAGAVRLACAPQPDLVEVGRLLAKVVRNAVKASARDGIEKAIAQEVERRRRDAIADAGEDAAFWVRFEAQR